MTRRGYSLIEMVVMIAASTVVVGLATTSLLAMFHLNREARSETALGESLARFAVRFREDAHAAKSLRVLDGDEAAVTLTLEGGGTIEYRRAAEGVARLRREKGRVTHRDTFRLGDDVVVAVEVDAAGSGPLARWTFSTPDDSYRGPDDETQPLRVILTVEAAVRPRKEEL